MRKTCFVVMGFGTKPDYATGRMLDLDKTYRVIIRPAVEEAGLECIRADDVIHSGMIDKPMYELLLSADVVVADLSTSNQNAIYELGVRHALRPHTTVVIAEKQFKFPFDLKSLLIRHYEHLEKGIDAEEAERARKDLTSALTVLLEQPEIDSPIFTFLPALTPAARAELTVRTARGVPPTAAAQSARAASAEELMDQFRSCRAEGNWSNAREVLKQLLVDRPKDTYLIQQLALATYKSGQPDALSALQEAHVILHQLNPARTTDPETLGLWGAIHKRLWELNSGRTDLDEAIWAYEKGFYLNDDYYTGINLAFLLNQRATVSSEREAIADVVTAERIRRRVIRICEKIWAEGSGEGAGKADPEQTFWLLATLAEAYIGIGKPEVAARIDRIARARAPEGWMVGSMDDQRKKLEDLLAKV